MQNIAINNNSLCLFFIRAALYIGRLPCHCIKLHLRIFSTCIPSQCEMFAFQIYLPFPGSQVCEWRGDWENQGQDWGRQQGHRCARHKKRTAKIWWGFLLSKCKILKEHICCPRNKMNIYYFCQPWEQCFAEKLQLTGKILLEVLLFENKFCRNPTLFFTHKYSHRIYIERAWRHDWPKLGKIYTNSNSYTSVLWILILIQVCID